MKQADDTAAVERLYSRLVDALRKTRMAAFSSPVTVAELYQQLVPYRLVRGDAGFQMNADYEHALLQLLSGEGGYARLEPASARDEIRRELDSVNPNVTVYREFAGCEVWIREPATVQPTDRPAAPVRSSAVDALHDILADDDDADTVWGGLAALGADIDDDAADAVAAVATFALVDDAGAAATDPVAESEASESEAPDAATSEAAPTMAPQPAPPGAVAERGACAYCDSALPDNRMIRFCPYCGGDQATRPCHACGEALEAGWSFCVACGVERSDP